MLKEALLSHLSIYGRRGCLDFKSFKILFQNDVESTQGWEEVRFLDLTELLNEHFTLNDLLKCVKRPVAQAVEGMEELNVNESTKKGKESAVVFDSWEEEEVDEPSSPQAVLPAHLKTPYFWNLTRLSLAYPGERASWPDLLKISPNLNKITHLSLAYWPRPSTTPNAVTTSLVSKYASVSMGGTQFYSDLDDDWHEASNILRRFAANTYSLEWLDLEGCHWLRALTWNPSGEQPAVPTSQSDNTDTWNTSTSSPGPDWNDSWPRIAYLNFFQGWIPSDHKALQNMPAGIIPVQLMCWLRQHRDSDEERWKLNPQETGHAVAEWMVKEKAARVVGAEIQMKRKSAQGVYCRIDHGWSLVGAVERPPVGG